MLDLKRKSKKPLLNKT